MEGALAFRKASQIKGPRSIKSDRSLSMAIPGVQGGYETDAKPSPPAKTRGPSSLGAAQSSVLQTEECREIYTRWPLGGY